MEHGGRSPSACDNTDRPAVYSRCGSKPQHKTARGDDIMDRQAWRGNRETAGTRVDVTDLAAEPEPPPRRHVDAATELQRTRIRVLLTRVGAAVVPQPRLSGCAVPLTVKRCFRTHGSTVFLPPSSIARPRTTKPRGPKLACSVIKSGISLRHGTHQVAQKLTSTTCPRNWLSETACPSRFFSVKLGARPCSSVIESVIVALACERIGAIKKQRTTVTINPIPTTGTLRFMRLPNTDTLRIYSKLN